MISTSVNVINKCKNLYEHFPWISHTEYKLYLTLGTEEKKKSDMEKSHIFGGNLGKGTLRLIRINNTEESGMKMALAQTRKARGLSSLESTEDKPTSSKHTHRSPEEQATLAL